MGTRRPALDPLPADLRGRAARHRRGPGRRPARRQTGRRWPTPSWPTRPQDSLHASGRWQRAPDDERDRRRAAAGRRSAAPYPATDPRALATLGAVAATTSPGDGYLYRYRHDQRPLHEAEGAFVLCGFLMALATAPAGPRPRRRSAGSSATGPPAARPGCSPRSSTSYQRQLRGNLPQAFVPVLMFEIVGAAGPALGRGLTPGRPQPPPRRPRIPPGGRRPALLGTAGVPDPDPGPRFLPGTPLVSVLFIPPHLAAGAS